MERAEMIIARLDDLAWGAPMLALLLGSGIFLTVKLKGIPIRKLGYALRAALGWDARESKKEGGISPFASLMTELAATIGTGNIVGVATAMVLGGPGALVWMMVSALVGLSVKFSESFLSVRYRVRNDSGHFCGGPMYTLARAFPAAGAGRVLAILYAVFAVFASFGMGNMTQSNSIAEALGSSFEIPAEITGLIVTVLTILAVIGGIETISGFARVLVPGMAVLYVAGCLWVILVNFRTLPAGLTGILRGACSLRAAAGGTAGIASVSAARALRYGVSRGVFSNEAGLGAGGITAAAAETDDPVRQGYISMTGVFLDTIVICLVTGLALSVSGVLGMTGDDGAYVTGAALVIEAFSTAFGRFGGCLVSIAIALFAFATMIGWEYQGERAFTFLTGRERYGILYRFLYGLAAFPGAVCAMQMVWNFSELMNALMAVPNLICVLVLSGTVKKELMLHEEKER